VFETTVCRETAKKNLLDDFCWKLVVNPWTQRVAGNSRKV
jgi:hypothetical protein